MIRFLDRMPAGIIAIGGYWHGAISRFVPLLLGFAVFALEFVGYICWRQ